MINQKDLEKGLEVQKDLIKQMKKDDEIYEEQVNDEKFQINIKQKCPPKQLEIFLRQEKVWSLYLQGYTQIEISKKLNVDPKTISRDFNQLKIQSAQWMHALPKGEIQMHFKEKCEIIKRVTRELWKLNEYEDDPKLKLKILNSIADKTKLLSNTMESIKVFHVRDRLKHHLKHPQNNDNPLAEDPPEIDYKNDVQDIF